MGAKRLLIENGRVWLPSGYVTEDTVLVEGDRIRALGDEAQELAAGAESLDARGGSVLPGFQDGHVHPYHWALRAMDCNLEEAADGQEVLDTIATFAAANPDRPWITGGGWAMSVFGGSMPTREMLDSVVPDRPAYFPYTDGHGAWVNSKALEIAGIDDATPDPFTGRIERDERGRATGMLEELAMDLVADRIPEPSEAVIDRAFERAYRRMIAWGLVGWQDAMVGRTKNWVDNHAGYLRAVDSGLLRTHVVGALCWDPLRGLEQIPELIEQRERAWATAPFFSASAVKVFQDGVIENFTAGMFEPYLDACGHTTENTGNSIVDPELLCEVVAELSRNGFQVHMHALGDRAVHEALNAVEHSNRVNGDQDRRHTIAHIQVIDPVDIPRFAELGVVANSQPLWARHEVEMDEMTTPYLGARRGRMQYPFGALKGAGAVLAGGSDWPVTTADPIEIIHTAVTRSGSGAQGEERRPFLGEQALSLADAVRAHTEGVAYLNHDEERSGSIEPGKAADLVIMDRDLFDAPVSEIGDASVRYTLLAGDVAYEHEV
ncbi:amidohydrolase [Leucobacter sp. CSA1]|uniref:Amidohydrolase n=1 Tax=Leucobacter chromiisoli TaxID=2796471 RepID=A0A934QAP9_9MICO|nr:amidohydrolase [Leucobacter chromiisoli]MBK0420415.1 amidohydrolase [Leucobacter chromiisoli]